MEVRGVLMAAGHDVWMIGERGDYAELHHRTRDARGANLFVSIHHDSVQERLLPQADRFAGFSLFISRSNPPLGKSLACPSALRPPLAAPGSSPGLAEGLACASATGAGRRAAGFVPSRYHADPVLGEDRPFADEAN